MEVTKVYKWMEILEDGLLKEPDEIGPYYSTSCLNGWGGFETEEAAIEAWKKFKEIHTFEVPSELVLVPVYSLR